MPRIFHVTWLQAKITTVFLTSDSVSFAPGTQGTMLARSFYSEVVSLSGCKPLLNGTSLATSSHGQHWLDFWISWTKRGYWSIFYHPPPSRSEHHWIGKPLISFDSICFDTEANSMRLLPQHFKLTAVISYQLQLGWNRFATAQPTFPLRGERLLVPALLCCTSEAPVLTLWPRYWPSMLFW